MPATEYSLKSLQDQIDLLFTQTSTISTVTDIYVDQTGNDSTGNGTVGTPYRQITRALQDLAGKKILAQTRILVSAGTFNPFSVDEIQAVGELFSIVGTWNGSTGTTISAASGIGIAVSNSKVKLSGFRINSPSIGLKLDNGAYVILESVSANSIDIDNIVASGSNAGIQVYNGSTVDQRLAIRIGNTGASSCIGISLYRNSSYITISNLTITVNGSIGISQEQSCVFKVLNSSSITITINSGVWNVTDGSLVDFDSTNISSINMTLTAASQTGLLVRNSFVYLPNVNFSISGNGTTGQVGIGLEKSQFTLGTTSSTITNVQTAFNVTQNSYATVSVTTSFIFNCNSASSSSGIAVATSSRVDILSTGAITISNALLLTDIATGSNLRIDNPLTLSGRSTGSRVVQSQNGSYVNIGNIVSASNIDILVTVRNKSYVSLSGNTSSPPVIQVRSGSTQIIFCLCENASGLDLSKFTLSAGTEVNKQSFYARDNSFIKTADVYLSNWYNAIIVNRNSEVNMTGTFHITNNLAMVDHAAITATDCSSVFIQNLNNAAGLGNYYVIASASNCSSIYIEWYGSSSLTQDSSVSDPTVAMFTVVRNSNIYLKNINGGSAIGVDKAASGTHIYVKDNSNFVWSGLVNFNAVANVAVTNLGTTTGGGSPTGFFHNGTAAVSTAAAGAGCLVKIAG